MRLISVFIVISTFAFVNTDVDKKNFGPYNIIWQRLDFCKGPKQGDCGVIGITNKENVMDLEFNLDITKDCPITAAKIMVNTKQKDNSTKKLWNHVLGKPCQHFVLGPVLKESLNVGGNNCKINKGVYSAHVNLQEKTEMFLSENFFYGTYLFKIIMHNKNDNLICFLTEMEIAKK